MDMFSSYLFKPSRLSWSAGAIALEAGMFDDVRVAVVRG